MLTSLLATPLGALPAALISAGAFGVAHLASGWRALGFSVGFALAMQGLVELSSGVLLAIAVHAIYDLLAAWLAQRVRASEPPVGLGFGP